MPSKRKLFNYEEGKMLSAVEAVRNGMSKKNASKTFGVPRATLVRKVTGSSPNERRMGPLPELGIEKEKRIRDWLIGIARKGFPIRKETLFQTIKKCLDESGSTTRFKDNLPGETWWRSFKKRHPTIVEKSAESLTNSRAQVSEKDIREWFSHVSGILTESGQLSVLDNPNRVFNADETGFLLCPKTDRVIGPRGTKEDFYQVKPNNEKEQLTVMGAFAADGWTVPPMIIYPYVRVPKTITNSIPVDLGIGQSPTGWMNGEVFFEYISNHFIPKLEARGVTFPVVLFVDGHRSHLTLYVSELCEAKGVILIALHPNSTHILQPADVSVFRPLKVGWKKIAKDWNFTNFPEVVTRVTFAKLIKDVFDKYATKECIINGFRKCGLYPFSADGVDYTKCLQSRSVEEVNTSAVTTMTALQCLELKINPTTLQLFKTCHPGKWNGSLEAVDLYNVWQSFMKDMPTVINGGSKENVADQEEMNLNTEKESAKEYVAYQEVTGLDSSINIVPQCTTENTADQEEMEINAEGECATEYIAYQEVVNIPINTEAHFTTENATDQQSVAMGKEPRQGGEVTPAKSSLASTSVETLQKFQCENTATPFKKYLFYPKTPPKKIASRIPKVISAPDYRLYLEKKEAVKEEKERIKEEKKKERLMKAELKRKAKAKSPSSESETERNETYSLHDSSEGEDFIGDASSSESSCSELEPVDAVDVAIGTYCVTEFRTKKSKKFFVGRVEGVNKDEISMKFMRHKKGGKFVWPDNADPGVVGIDQLVKILYSPQENRRGLGVSFCEKNIRRFMPFLQ